MYGQIRRREGGGRKLWNKNETIVVPINSLHYLL